MSDDFIQHQREDARLVMLRALSAQPDDMLNETMLFEFLKSFGYRKDRNFVRAELDMMAELGAVKLHKAGEFYVAEITERGARHVAREVTIPGIRRPSRAAV
ncbi:hypothetical protein [Aureimonas sp. SK2]|uniref:VpaChn25_0724 family phage protein n=1 Tax=Aureimonas sp. SK2 TaxID=3015992 RepID=UPI0024446AED|nr:hypothetical protein [Aureimonas sp. SK2]